MEQRKATLERERKAVERVKEGKQEQKKYALNQNKENTVVSVNQQL